MLREIRPAIILLLALTLITGVIYPFAMTDIAGALLRRNLMIYGLGGIVIPFIGIKVIDLAVVALHLA